MRWFRVYGTLIDDPKVQRLPAPLFKVLVNLWCLASQHDGALPGIEEIAFRLRIKYDKLEKILIELKEYDLLDGVPDTGYRPHNWDVRQYKTDVTDPTNAERQKRFRNRHAVTDTVTVSNGRSKRPDSDTDSEQKESPSDSCAVADATRPKHEKDFDEFWKSYPKRDGANPKAPARKTFFAFLKTGVDPGEIVAGARKCAEVEAAKVGTPYIPQAIKWLRDRRWEDYLRQNVVAIRATFHAEEGSAELDAWDRYWRQTKGMNAPRSKHGGSFFDSQWPPGHEQVA